MKVILVILIILLNSKMVICQIDPSFDFGYSLAYAVYKDTSNLSLDDIKYYANSYDKINYNNKINDEFEKNDYILKMKKKLIDKISKVSFSGVYLNVDELTFGEYLFDEKCFPLIMKPPRWNLWRNEFYIEPGTNFLYFNLKWYIDESAAKIFLNRRKDINGNIDRKLYCQIKYSITKKWANANESNRLIQGRLVPYYYSIELFEDKLFKKKIGTLLPTKDYYNKIEVIKLNTGFDTTYFANDYFLKPYEVYDKKIATYIKISEYKDSKIIDVKWYYITGEIYKEGKFKPSHDEFGLADGVVNQYWQNGYKSLSTNYINGIKNGCEFKWDKNGKCDFFWGASMYQNDSNSGSDRRCTCVNQY
jgi:hypothetical protein